MKTNRKKSLDKTFSVSLDTDPRVPWGFKVEEHQKGGEFTGDVSKIALYLSEKQVGTDYVGGRELREKIRGKSVFNANLLDYLLAHPYLIPSEWKSQRIFFWGTIYNELGGGPCIRCLHWHVDSWYSTGQLLSSGWDSNSPAAVPAS